MSGKQYSANPKFTNKEINMKVDLNYKFKTEIPALANLLRSQKRKKRLVISCSTKCSITKMA